MMNAIILCGGLSTRLGDITKQTPKILLDIGGKSVLDWQLQKLHALGIEEVVLAAGHLARVLYDEIGEKREDVSLIYAIEDKQLGTGGAIKHAMQYIKNSDAPAWVLNGDVLSSHDFSDMAEGLHMEMEGILLGTKVEDAAVYGTLEFDTAHHLTAFKEKEGKHVPGYINGGVYLFNPRVRDYFPPEDVFSIEYDVFPYMKHLCVYPSETAWIDIGVPERLEWARKHWME